MKEGVKRGFLTSLIAFAIAFIIGILSHIVMIPFGSSFDKDFFIANTVFSLGVGILTFLIYTIDLSIKRKRSNKKI